MRSSGTCLPRCWFTSFVKSYFGMTASQLLLPQLPSAKVTCWNLSGISPLSASRSCHFSPTSSGPLLEFTGPLCAVPCWGRTREPVGLKAGRRSSRREETEGSGVWLHPTFPWPPGPLQFSHPPYPELRAPKYEQRQGDGQGNSPITCKI